MEKVCAATWARLGGLSASHLNPSLHAFKEFLAPLAALDLSCLSWPLDNWKEMERMPAIAIATAVAMAMATVIVFCVRKGEQQAAAANEAPPPHCRHPKLPCPAWKTVLGY